MAKSTSQPKPSRYYSGAIDKNQKTCYKLHMSETDPFYSRVSGLAGTTYEVDDLLAEITAAQAKQLYERVGALVPDLEMDVDLTGALELQDEGFSDELIANWYAQLAANDRYEVFGSDVYLDKTESITQSWDSVRISVHTTLNQSYERAVVESDMAVVLVHAGNGDISPMYEHKISEHRPKQPLSAEALLLRHLFPDPPDEKKIAVYHAVREMAYSRGDSTFTQARWAKFMQLLDVVEILQELGLKNTNDLNSG